MQQLFTILAEDIEYLILRLSLMQLQNLNKGLEEFVDNNNIDNFIKLFSTKVAEFRQAELEKRKQIEAAQLHAQQQKFQQQAAKEWTNNELSLLAKGNLEFAST